MSVDYKPTTEWIRTQFGRLALLGWWMSIDPYNYNTEAQMAIFNRWLAAHDAEVRDKALTLTDDELAIAEGAFESSVMKYEGDGLVAMSVAFKAVAEDRRKQ